MLALSGENSGFSVKIGGSLNRMCEYYERW